MEIPWPSHKTSMRLPLFSMGLPGGWLSAHGTSRVPGSTITSMGLQ